MINIVLTILSDNLVTSSPNITVVNSSNQVGNFQ